MNIPETILLSQIDIGIRGRTEYHGIEQLAESLEHNGLVQAIILAPKEDGEGYQLIAGGRRLHAMMLLGATEVYHAVTSEPGRYGFLLKGEPGTELTNLLTEIAENLDRHDVDWRDEVKMLVRAARLVKKDAYDKGHAIIMRDLGTILGCGYQDYRAAEAVHDDLIANPQDYAACGNQRAAYQVLLKKNQRFLEAEAVKRSIRPTVSVQSEPKQEGGDSFGLARPESTKPDLGETAVPPTVIPLTDRFRRCNGIVYLEACNSSFDHIICDPDFAVSKDRLAAGATLSAEGVAQDSVETSLSDLARFIRASFFALRDKGFLCFFMDLDHWEKIQTWCWDAGFAVQRWPIIWHKTDYRSNASPACNTCKNIEYLVVARKPGACFAQSPQMSSIWSLPSAAAARDFGHPFAKPRELWTKIYQMCCIKGQTVFDPFMGSGSSTVTAIEFGLNPIGCEVQEQHYNSAILNLQKCYRKLLGDNVTFQ